jgi:hypothetical protein
MLFKLFFDLKKYTDSSGDEQIGNAGEPIHCHVLADSFAHTEAISPLNAPAQYVLSKVELIQVKI